MPTRDEVASAVAKRFEYLLNAMENAAAQESPAKHGYAGKRQMVLNYVADSELRIQELSEALRQGILAMTGRARNVWADKARALLSALHERSEWEEKPR